ncbi:chromate transporter [Halopseudomonas pachastrellae]|nr:chromate transporter [Halopseudomonas pachastrellae]
MTAIVVQAAHRIGSRALKNNWLWAIAAASFVAIFALNLPFPLIVLGAAVIGYFGGRFAPQKFSVGGGHGAAKQSFGSALIDDDTPTPKHARFRWPRLLVLAVIGATLWALPMGLLTALFGWEGTLTQMGWFFTKAALLTFGGAYAVLPYVYQGAVSHYGWLSPTQMIDGLALGETTPGAADHGGGLCRFRRWVCATGIRCRSGLLAGAVAASLVTWFTFLPSFLFILAGGPLVESTHNELKFTRTADGHHRRRGRGDPQPGTVLRLPRALAARLQRSFRLAIGLIALAAAIALFRFKRGVIQVLAACALVGLAVHLLQN